MFEGERALGATFDPAEIWRPVVGFEGYQVSNLGRVKNRHGRLLKPGRSSNGYFTVALGRGNSRCIHDLVLTAFVGPRPPGQEALHGSPDRTDSRLANLRWGTRSDNNRDAVAHGTWHSAKRIAGWKSPKLVAACAKARAAQSREKILASLAKGRETRWGRKDV